MPLTLGMFEPPLKDMPEILAWGIIEKLVSDTGDSSWIENLTEYIHAVCEARVVGPLEVTVGLLTHHLQMTFRI